MKKLLVFLLFLHLAANGQKKPPPTQGNKSDAERMIEKELKELEKTNPEGAKMAREMMRKQQAELTTKESMGSENYSKKPPVKDEVRLRSVATAPMAKPELITYIKKMRSELLMKLEPQEKINYESALMIVGPDARKMEDAAIINWLKKSAKGALLFAMHAAETNADEPMYLNNLGAMLVQYGRQEKAIPVLRTVLNAHPKSSMALNNLGQAYLGLGDLETAKKYFQQCLALVPTHPEANHSMGLIYRFMGNTAQSHHHFEQELKVVYRKPVFEILKSAESKNLSGSLRLRWSKPPNYFTQLGLNDFQVPALPSSIDESNRLYKTHEDFRDMIKREVAKIGERMQSIAMSGVKSSQHNIHSDLVEALLEMFQEIKAKQLKWMEVISDQDVTSYPSRGNPTTPQWKNLVATYLSAKDVITRSRLHADSLLTDEYEKKIKAGGRQEALDPLYNEKYLEVKIKHCQKEIDLANSYLPQFAALQKNGFDDHRSAFPDLINEAFYYSSLAPDEPAALLEANNLVIQYLIFLEAYSALTTIANTPANGHQGQGVVWVGCDMEALLAQKVEIATAGDYNPDCPYKLSLPLVVAKISLDCKKLEVEGGEGLIVGAEYEFKTGNTTLSIGAGVEANIPFVSVGAKNQAYVTFDSDGNYSDSGIKGEIGAEIGGMGPTVVSKESYEVGINAGASVKIEGMGKETRVF